MVGGKKHAFIRIACFGRETGMEYSSKTSFANVSSICTQKAFQDVCVILMLGFKDCESEMGVRTWSAHGVLFLLVEPLDCDGFWQLMMPLQQEFVAVRAPRNSCSTLNAATTLVLVWNFSSFGQVDFTAGSLADV